MTNRRGFDPETEESAGSVETSLKVVQIHLEAAGRSSRKSAMSSAILGAGGGPVYRFVATLAETGNGDEPVATGVTFPLLPFHDPDQQADYEWTDLARRRLDELGSELEAAGWRRRGDRGRHWWSLRYER